jgi:hypothetical protein
MATVGPFVSALGESATLHTRVLGARNAVTQWPAVTYTDSTIKIMIDDIMTRVVDTPAGNVSENVVRGYVGGAVTVNMLDRITYNGKIYEISSVPTIEYLLGSVAFKKLEMVLRTE